MGLGAAIAGVRSLVTMKHVGVNVAADPFMAAASTGVNAGLVLLAADDPSCYSSQNEQDSRFYAAFGRIPCLDVADSQDCYEMARAAFELSERFDTPVICTRPCASRTPARWWRRPARARPWPRATTPTTSPSTS